MIDTVVIVLDRRDFIISKAKRFNPSAEGLIHAPMYPKSNQGFFKCVNNPTKKEIEKHGYLPRLTLIARNGKERFSLQLKIEFSAPKILYGNNFDELCDEDSERLISELKNKLRIMGVVTFEDKLCDASVSAIHYSKNIVLDRHTSCSFVLNELRKINLNKKLDLSNTDYRNYGHAVRYHTNSYEIVFYDKVKDLERSKISAKRSIEKDPSNQLELFNELNYPPKYSILRMEVRLANRKTLRNHLEKLNFDSDFSFKKLFRREISKEILQYYFQQIWENWHIGISSKAQPEDLFIQIHRETGYKPSKIFGLIGTLIIINSIGFQGLRNLLGDKSLRTWQRTKSEILNLNKSSVYDFNAFQELSIQLNKFDNIRLSDFNFTC